MMTRERMRWYCDALETAADADGTFKIAEPTIHTDDEFARSQGLRGIIADGMISTNWISSLLVRRFGMDYVSRGELGARFIRPIYEDESIETCAEVTEVETVGETVTITLDVWCATSDGAKCTVGSAKILLANE
jgi:acyl dehydratase